MATKRIEKSTLSMFLRTKCDRGLFFSLHKPKVLEASGMPVPLQARPGIGVLQTAGRDFEDERNKQLIEAFGHLVLYKPDKGGNDKPVKAPLKSLLDQVSEYPSVLLQGKFSPSKFQKEALENIGLQEPQISQVPEISGLIPDIIIVRSPMDGDEEVASDGTRKSIDFEAEQRHALTILDVKHTSEANPSYSAEVALYALFLSNWIVDQGLEGDYYVSVRSYLWTRFKQGESELDRLMSAATPASPNQLLEALFIDSEDANLRFYLPTVLHFFREDLIRVINKGDASWGDLEWHVDGRCSACDWLGHEKWVSAVEKEMIKSQPSHYCYPAAELTGHLSQIAGMTRGARKTLQIHDIQNTESAANASATSQVFQEHSHLKKERNRIPLRAQALLLDEIKVDDAALLASLAPFPQMHVAITVNFDASAGLLTGLSIFGRATAYIKGQSPRQFRSKSFMIDQKSLDAEWVALEGLLSSLSDMIEQSEKFVKEAGKKPLTAQIAFWEKRQFEELCAAMGRHLPKVFALSDRKTKALAWLFPAEELLEKQDGAISPCVFFVDEIVRRVVFTPTPHVITLFDTAEVYYSGASPIVERDPFYREFLTNGIPRERIYEIWSNVTTIKRGSVTVPRNTVIQEFGNALDKQCRALNSVVEKLRMDFKGQIKANAPNISLSIPQGARGVAFDSKLWVWWQELQYNTRKLEDHQRLALDSDTLEAGYEAIRLTNGRCVNEEANEYTFDVLAGSTEAKLDDADGFLTLGKDGHPGLPLLRVKDLLAKNAPPYSGDDKAFIRPIWSVLTVTLLSFDRDARKALVKIHNWHDPKLFPYLLKNSSIDLMNDVFITKGKGTFKWYDTVKAILKAVGNPPIAVADVNAANAMGAAPQSPGTDSITPLSQVLWQADLLHEKCVIPREEAEAISNYAASKADHGLNASQKEAVIHAAEKGLTIIWGPPGTGKTQTLAGCIHGLVHNSVQRKKPLNILVTGPTYKAVEELIERVLDGLDNDPSSPADVFVGYSSSKMPKTFSVENAHVQVSSFNLSPGESETQACIDSLQENDSITIVSTSSMQCNKFSQWMFSTPVGEVFDVVIIDESSQVEVGTALSPLATIKEGGRLIVAGDHLQMPPIQALEAPVGAEYLVGSIQKYLLKRFDGKVTDCPLEKNYRSAEDIVAYAKTIGYRQSLQSSNPETSLHLLSDMPSPTQDFLRHLPWSSLWRDILDADKKVLTLLHEDDLSSQSNVFEAKVVAALAYCLRSMVSAELSGRSSVNHASPTAEQFWDICVGIVTPHRAQRAQVIRELKRVFPNDPVDLIDSAVDTVEKFQGGQRHTVIVTFGVGDSDVIMGEEAFLMQLERTNVAISRAMAKCLVVMPLTLAGHVPQDKKALETAHAIKDYVDEFCNREVNGEIVLGEKSRKAKLRYHEAT